MGDWLLHPLERGVYGVVCVDPPWTFSTWSPKGITAKGAGGQYSTMTMGDIVELPIGELAAPDSILFLWATWPLIEHAFRCIDAWGFSYKTGGIWIKRTVNGHVRMGTGFRVRSGCEPWLIGVRGKPITSRSHINVINGLAREHSRKPDEAYAWLESYMLDARRADVFARERRARWDTWGDEADKFSPAPSLPASP